MCGGLSPQLVFCLSKQFEKFVHLKVIIIELITIRLWLYSFVQTFDDMNCHSMFVNFGKSDLVFTNGVANGVIYHFQLNGNQLHEKSAINVYLKLANGQYINTLSVFGGHQGNFWKRGYLTLNSVQHRYQVSKDSTAQLIFIVAK